MPETPVHINGRFLSQALTGVQRYAIETVMALDRLLDARPASRRRSYELLLPPGISWTHATLANIGTRNVGRLSGHAWEQVELPFHAPGLLVNLCNTFPVLARRPMVTVHDASIVAAPSGYTRAFIAAYRLLFGALRLRRSVTVLTDSRFSAGELHAKLGIARERIRIAYCGADHWSRIEPDPSILARLGIVDSRFVLGVASENPNKNLARLVEAFDLLDDSSLRLVLVGGRNDSVFAAGTFGASDRVLRTGRIDDRALAALYEAASVFAFPSLYEGFGLPPVEAMRFGCPVVVSREASIPEVCGDAAYFCDGRDTGSIRAALAAVLEQPLLRERLRADGFRQAGRYRWQDTASAVLTEIESLSP